MKGGPESITAQHDQKGTRDGQSLPWRSLAVVVGPSLVVATYAICGTLATLAHALGLVGSGRRRIAGSASVGGALLPWAYILFVRPWHSRWGASREEANGPLPYDHFVPRPLAQTTRAVTIEAPPRRVWRWLVQLGVGRGGLYSYDWLENLADLDVHSADEIVPELQDLEVGDLVRLAPERLGADAGWRVSVMEPERALVLHQPADAGTGLPLDRGDPDLVSYFGWNWAFVLGELEGGRTRLLVRSRVDGAPRPLVGVLYVLLLEFPHFVMERGMLKGIKKRAGGCSVWHHVEKSGYQRKDRSMNIFPTTILLGTDGSDDAKLASDTAAALAEDTGSGLHVVCVGAGLPLYELPDYPVSFEEAVKAQRRAAQGTLDEQVGDLERAGVTVEEAHLTEDERPGRSIVELAEDLGAGLVVVGSRGLSGLKRALLGSVSASVVHHAHCPVLVVRDRPFTGATRVLLATDGSEEARGAAGAALELTRKLDSELHVTYVEPMPERSGGLARSAVQLPPEVVASFEREARAKLEKEVRLMKEDGAEIAGAYARTGDPPAETVDLAEELGVGLVVVGTRGLGGMRRALMGSVSDAVVAHAHCPVMVVRGSEV